MTGELKVPTEIYSRISGYFRPVRQWNIGKKAEFANRIYLSIPESVKHEARQTTIS